VRYFTAAMVCAAILYGLDAYLFDGMYFGAFGRMLSNAARHFR
jgi:hypothetical protein